MSAAVAERRESVEVKLTPVQSAIYSDPARFRVVVAGRRSGKTWLGLVELITHAAANPGSLVWFIAPTIQDARDTAFKPVLDLLDPRQIRDFRRQPMEVSLRNGSEIQFTSAERLNRGRGLDFAVLDEFAFYSRDLWEQEIRPSLSDRGGRALFTTTPRGHDWAYDIYLKGLSDDPDWSSYQFPTIDGGIVPAEEIEAARRDLDERVFRQEYEASFETLAGRVYSNFCRETVPDGNLDPSLEDIGGDLLVGMDFNVNPMSAVIAVRAGDECHVLDALEIQTSNTDEMASEIRNRYPDRSIVVCPDPSGRARKTSAPVGQTDFTILRRHNLKVRAPSKAPPVVDRINNVQSNLKAGDGRMRCLIHPDAQPLIRGLDGLTYKEGTSLPDKSLGLDHITDALGYLLWEEFNLLKNRDFTTEHFRVV